jgi:hypothetical protein
MAVLVGASLLFLVRMAEGVGFEPTRPFGLPVFKTGAFDHSATPPVKKSGPGRGNLCTSTGKGSN